jgi:hypothetical protein
LVSNPFIYEKNWGINYDVFIEFKQVTKGMIVNDAKKGGWSTESFKKLLYPIQRERCNYVYVCIVDDDPEDSGINQIKVEN